MIANTAFLAAVTTFLIVAWLAGELSYLSALQDRPVPPAWHAAGSGHGPDLPEPVRRLLLAGSCPVPS